MAQLVSATKEYRLVTPNPSIVLDVLVSIKAHAFTWVVVVRAVSQYTAKCKRVTLPGLRSGTHEIAAVGHHLSELNPFQKVRRLFHLSSLAGYSENARM